MNREFLTFASPTIHAIMNREGFEHMGYTDANFATISVLTDSEGGFEFLANISLQRFSEILPTHLEIITGDCSENEKLRMLVSLWITVDDRISGYLFGDLPEDPEPGERMAA